MLICLKTGVHLHTFSEIIKPGFGRNGHTLYIVLYFNAV